MVQDQDLKQVRAGVLDIAYFELGPKDGTPTILLHGFPYDAHRCIVPFLRGYGATRFSRRRRHALVSRRHWARTS